VLGAEVEWVLKLEEEREGVPAWRRTLMRSRGLPIRIPAAPLIYPAQKSADIVILYQKDGLGRGANQVIVSGILLDYSPSLETCFHCFFAAFAAMIGSEKSLIDLFAKVILVRRPTNTTAQPRPALRGLGKEVLLTAVPSPESIAGWVRRMY
jgi:hypothetical protein